VYPASFEYHRPASVAEAVALLARHGDDAKLLAGGHSLIPLMKLRLAQPAHLVDIGRIDGLSGIRVGKDAVAIGALTTHNHVASSRAVRQALPVLAEAADGIGDQQVRNRGTIGGSLAHADPAADWPALALALGARLTATGSSGSRTIAADEFFLDLLTTALRPDEILTEVQFPIPPAGSGSAYVKHAHPASRFAVCGVAVRLVPGAGGTCKDVRVAITGVGAKATRAVAVEHALDGQKPDAAAIAAAAERADQSIEMTADLQGGVDYKQHLTRVCTRRALERAAGKMKG
jgi:carbon-monoxide dehydrogenase medium subunit